MINVMKVKNMGKHSGLNLMMRFIISVFLPVASEEEREAFRIFNKFLYVIYIINFYTRRKKLFN